MSALHVTNGDHAGDKLRAFADGPVVITADVLHEGPAPALDGDAWYATRGAFLGDSETAARSIAAKLAAADRTIRDALGGGGEVVLWFEHDLFDQLQLIRVLHLAGRTDSFRSSGARLSLICIDGFPGVERFIGLGQLDENQLQSLYPSRQPVTGDQLTIAAAAWNAFRSSDPRALRDLAVSPTTAALPFLGDALLRFLAEYPSTENGLTQTEQCAVSMLENGPLTCGELFMKTQAIEPRPFMGDLTFFDTLRALAEARTPLVEIDAPAERLDIRADRVAITDAGRAVAALRNDRVALNGIAMWRGGVHLAGDVRSPFRWDAARKTLVS